MATTPQSATGGGNLVRTLGVMDLVFLNMAAILGLRWLSTAAQMGPSSLVLWVLAVVTFFIPSALTVRELSSRLPGEGGIYLWSKAAFGEQHGFISGWAYWVNNLFTFHRYFCLSPAHSCSLVAMNGWDLVIARFTTQHFH